VFLAYCLCKGPLNDPYLLLRLGVGVAALVMLGHLKDFNLTELRAYLRNAMAPFSDV